MSARRIGNLGIGYDDATLLSAASIASHSAEDSDYPAENLLDGNPSTRWKCTDTGTIHVEFDLGSSHMIKGIALINHNAMDVITSGSQLVVKYGGVSNPSDVAITDNVLVCIGSDDFIHIFNPDSTYTGRYWRIEITNVGTSGFMIGRIYLFRGLFHYDGGLALGLTGGWQHDCDILKTKGGTEYRISRGRVNTSFQGRIPMATSQLQSDLLSLIETAGCDQAIVSTVATGENIYSGDNIYGRAIYGYLDLDNFVLTPKIGGRADISLAIRGSD